MRFTEFIDEASGSVPFRKRCGEFFDQIEKKLKGFKLAGKKFSTR